MAVDAQEWFEQASAMRGRCFEMLAAELPDEGVELIRHGGLFWIRFLDLGPKELINCEAANRYVGGGEDGWRPFHLPTNGEGIVALVSELTGQPQATISIDLHRPRGRRLRLSFDGTHYFADALLEAAVMMYCDQWKKRGPWTPDMLSIQDP
jgi:hypothetical protein